MLAEDSIATAEALGICRQSQPYDTVMPTLTICAPAASPQIPDDPQFLNPFRHAPVGAHFEADGEVVSTGIDFSDFSRMRVQTRGTGIYRQKPTPEYALNHDSMRRLLVRFMEARAFSKKQIAAGMRGSDATRLRRAHEALLADVPRLEALATKLCQEYIESKNYGARKEWLKQAEIEIEGTDTQIILAKRLPEIIVGVIWRSYSLCEDSVAVGKALGLKPPATRQLLHRLSKVWKQMQKEDAAPAPIGRLRKTPPERLVAARAESAKWFANLTPEEKAARRVRVNKTSAAWQAEQKKDPAWCDKKRADNRARERIARSIASENARRAKALTARC